MALTHVPVAPLPPQRFRELLGDRYGELEEAIAQARERFAGRAVWHVNSTARGGGVAELLQSLLAYAPRWRGRCAVGGRRVATRTSSRSPSGSTTSFTARLGTAAHWARTEHKVYDETLREATEELADTVAPNDIVFLHDPQTAGLVKPVRQTGATVVWRCHVGLDLPNDLARQAWDFLRGYVEEAHAYVFSREEFVWEGLDREKVWIVAPSIDAFSPKNQELDAETVKAILAVAGLAGGRRRDAGHVHARGRHPRAGGPCRGDVPGRADSGRRAPDHPGIAVGPPQGPDRGGPVLRSASRRPRCAAASRRSVRRGGERRSRGRRGTRRGQVLRARSSNLRCAGGCTWPPCPMDDVQENAAIVNAIQRRSRHRRPEEPRGGLRTDGRRGDVEGAAGRRDEAAAASRIRSSTARAESCSTIRWTWRRWAVSSCACWRTTNTPAALERPPVSG